MGETPSRRPHNPARGPGDRTGTGEAQIGGGAGPLDLLFTVPAYLLIFSVIWFFINRYRYPIWHYVIAMGFGQALGDGGIFFFASAPAMLFFLPYPATNYHAINVIPFLAVCDDLPPWQTWSALAWLAVPGLIATYLVCGAVIQFVGRYCGLAPS